MKHLALYLAGALQSWGDSSRFDLRETLPYPTKSGVTGLLLAAAGVSGAATELLSRLAAMPFAVLIFDDRGHPRLRDFHMVGNGYDKKDKWQELFIPRKNDGNFAVGGGAKLTYRYYLQDRAFGAVFAIPDDLEEYFVSALKSPRFDLYLGRKCCAPSALIFRGCFADGAAAVDALTAAAKENGKTAVSMIRDAKPDEEGEVILLHDVPLEFGLHRRYRERKVVEENITPSGSEE